MKDPNQCAQLFDEKNILQDFISTQRQISAAYNEYAGECVNEQLRGAFLSILDDEHRIQANIFNNMNAKGWYPVQQAEQQKIQQARQKFSSKP